jgi:enoyl-CoA hydratase
VTVPFVIKVNLRMSVMECDQEPVKIEHNANIAIITFNRPKILNAFNNKLMETTLTEVIKLNENKTVRAIIVRGEGRAFSPGFDLKAAGEREMKDVRDWETQMQLQFDFIMQFWNSPKPTIAAVHGYCLAGAFELALACDITVAADNTKFGEPEVKFGTGIVAMLLPWITGPKQAKEILLTGEDQLSAHEALRMGIINKVVPEEEVYEKALAMAKNISQAGERAVYYTKRAINSSYEAMGMQQALKSGLDQDVLLNIASDPIKKKFGEIRKNKGLKAAIEWRDKRFS